VRRQDVEDLPEVDRGASERTKLEDTIAKSCAEDIVPFAAVSGRAGLNLQALEPLCRDFGIPTLSDVSSVADCLQRQHACEIVELVRRAVPRATELTDGKPEPIDGILDPLPAPLDCPTPQPAVPLKSMSSQSRAPRISPFITKFFSIPGRNAETTHAPLSSPGAPRRVSVFGSITKIRPGGSNSYTVRFSVPRDAKHGRAADAAPQLIITARRGDLEIGGFFTLDLPNAAEGEIAFDVQYPLDLETCVFELAFATNDGGEVSEYTTIDQVLDVAAPSTQSPSVTPTPTAITETPTPAPTRAPVVVDECGGASQTALQSGDAVSGCINPVADLDFFTVTLTTPSLVRLSLVWTSGGNNSHPCREIRNAANQIQGQGRLCSFIDSGGSAGVVEELVLQPGSYTVLVDEGGNDQAVTYVLSYDVIAPVNLPILESGTSVVDSLSPVGDLDLFRMQIDQPSLVRLALVWTSGGNNSHPCREIRNAANEIQGQGPRCSFIDSGGSAGVVEELMLQPGSYTVLIDEGGNNQTVTYVLTYDRLAPVTPLLPDAFVSESLSPVGDLDLFKLTVDKRVLIRLSLTWNSGGNNSHPCREIRNLANAPIGQGKLCSFISSGGSPTVTEEIVLDPGTYSVLVDEGGSDQTVTYTIGYQVIPIAP
jgi:hypothetical protein